MRTILSFFLVLSLSISTMMASVECLKYNYYGDTCPEAENTIQGLVNKAVLVNQGMAASLIKLHFQDCFIRGCDASVLLDSTPGKPAEKMNPAINPSTPVFELIDEIKGALEVLCPKTVSCADILAFAARDGASLVGKIDYAVQGGRHDGRVSNISEIVGNLPSPFFNVRQLRFTFAKKGFSVEEMVILSGAHSIGVAHCSSFKHCLYSFNTTNNQDPSLDNNYAAFLKTKCPNVVGPNSTVDPTVPLDPISPEYLDGKYYQELVENRGLLESDQTLFTSSLTSKAVQKFSLKELIWLRNFAKMMKSLGEIGVKDANEGEIRNNCRLVN